MSNEAVTEIMISHFSSKNRITTSGGGGPDGGGSPDGGAEDVLSPQLKQHYD